MAHKGRGPKVKPPEPGKRRDSTRAASKGGFAVPSLHRPKPKPKPKCGARKRDGGKCQRPAGWGTEHKGIGCCRLHGGTAPNHVKSAAKEEYRILLGKPIDVNPLDAIISCIKIRAGEVQWLSDRMAELDKESWIENTMVGKQFHLYARERQHAMSDLVRYSQIAISLGIAERAVKMAETYGELLAQYTKGIINDLWEHIDETGRELWPQVVRKHLLALDQGLQEPIKVAKAELPEANAA